MNENTKALSTALDAVRAKLIAMPRTSPGFGEMRMLYLELTNALIAAGDKADAELARQIESASKAVSEEWASNQDKIEPWLDVLRPVVDSVSVILRLGKLANPLMAFLP